MKIIKINSLTLYFLLVFFLCGYIKLGLIIFTIVIIHEMGHVTIASILKYKIKDVTIYPFGGITRLEKDINTSNSKEFLLASAGILFQLLMHLAILILPLAIKTKNLFYQYNLSIMLFNLLPIIPLDGSMMLKCFLNRYFSFKKSYIMYIIISIVVTIFYLIGNYYYSLNNYLIVGLFIYKIWDAIKNYKYIYNRFLLERYLHQYKFKYISTKKGDLDILKIDTYQYFKDQNKIKSEKEKLREKFDIY